MPSWLKKLKITSVLSSIPWVVCTLVATLIVVLWSFLGVMFSENPEIYFFLFDVSEKSRILEFLGIAMGGILLALQAAISYKRAKAMEDAARAQARATDLQAKANLNAEEGQRQERFKNAIEHLGHTSDSVRLGGAYELFYLARDTENLRQTVLDILCAHIRRTTSDAGYRDRFTREPSEEIQSLVTLLFVQPHSVFEGLKANLSASWLNGADLRGARLQKGILTQAYLQWAKLQEANLELANLEDVHMQKANLTMARMQGAKALFANLQGVHALARLEGAVLHFANMQGARCSGAILIGADLSSAKLQGADLAEACLAGANLRRAKLQGAFLGGTHLQGANLYRAELQGVTSRDRPNMSRYSENIRDSIDKESDFSKVIFEGGLEQRVIDLAIKSMPDKEADLRERLEPHIGKPISRLPPEGSEHGTYSAESAENWIAVYAKAMPR
ncbi:MAG: pentapeptide repeat-containing protein [Rhodobacteraceae bacterium]|nr:pentapeptide repeat-containing protein [Paracoccaceae bacterium]